MDSGAPAGLTPAAGVCPVCVEMLRELCLRVGSEPTCAAYSSYIATADDRWLDIAVAAAGPEAIARARDVLRQRGVLPRGAAPA